jgi:tRNA(adenine34) deaminase
MIQHVPFLNDAFVRMDDVSGYGQVNHEGKWWFDVERPRGDYQIANQPPHTSQYFAVSRKSRTDVETSAEHYMRETLVLAVEALEAGEFPIAAIVVLENDVIARATASEQRERRFLGHAELVALEEADRLGLSLDDRRAAKLFTNLEPCLMCMGAAMSFFLGEIYYGLESPGDGAVSLVQSWVRREDDIPGYRIPAITGGILRSESIELFEEYVARCPRDPMREWAETLTRL